MALAACCDDGSGGVAARQALASLTAFVTALTKGTAPVVSLLASARDKSAVPAMAPLALVADLPYFAVPKCVTEFGRNEVRACEVRCVHVCFGWAAGLCASTCAPVCACKLPMRGDTSFAAGRFHARCVRVRVPPAHALPAGSSPHELRLCGGTALVAVSALPPPPPFPHSAAW
jgi:hypothetical protein